MTQWANLLIPAGSVVVGGLLTGGLTLWGQALVNKGTHVREREARHDAFKVRQREIERDALGALQDTMSEQGNILTSTVLSRPFPPDVDERFHTLQMKIIAVSTRVPEDVADAVSTYIGLAWRVYKDPMEEDPDKFADAFRDAMKRAGQALMRDL